MEYKEVLKLWRGRVSEDVWVDGIKAWMEMIDMSQRELADALGVSEQYISKIFNNPIQHKKQLSNINTEVRNIAVDEMWGNELSKESIEKISSHFIVYSIDNLVIALGPLWQKQFPKGRQFYHPENDEEYDYLIKVLIKSYTNFVNYKAKKPQ